MDRRSRRHGGRSYGRCCAALALALAAGAVALSATVLAASPRRVQRQSASYHVPPRPLGSRTAGKPFRSGVVLVGFRNGVSAQQRAAIERAVGAWGARRLGPAIRPAGNTRADGEEYLTPFALQVPAKGELAVVRRLRRAGGVAYAEPDYLMSATALPNDPSFSLQWGDRNTGQAIPEQEINESLGSPAAGTPGADDGALKAWQVTTGSRSIVIGEADTGIDYEHPDLKANIWSNPGKVGGCPSGTHGYNVLAATCNPMDEDPAYGGHGTHVAGILGAVGNNGQASPG